MHLRSIKRNIGVYLLFIIFLSMFFTDFIMFIIARQELIKEESRKALFIIEIIKKTFITFDEAGSIIVNNNIEKILEFDNERLLSLIIDKEGNYLFSNLKKSFNNYEYLFRAANLAIMNNKTDILFYGKTWGVFWQEKKDLIVSSPILFHNDIAGSVIISFELEKTFSHLRTSQKISLIYIAINTIVFTILSLYIIVKIAIKPIHKLVKRAEEYKDEDTFNFIYEKEENEFGILSRSLNMMIKRISDDKKRLKNSLVSIEKANLELKKAQNEIIQAEKLASIGKLSAGIAHEIGNPIGIILGYLDLLKQKDITDKEKEDFINRAEKEISRIDTIIKQLLNFSRQPFFDPESKISAHKLIHEMLDIMKIQPIMSEIKLNMDLKADNDNICIDPNQLKQVFLNIMLNAGDAVRDSNSGCIKIYTQNIYVESKNTKMLKVTFKDNGIGIPKENLNNIFDPFFTTKDPGKGTGLGLYVCFMIIDKANGFFKIESNKGEGTSINIFIPTTN
ncbi:MAG: hypothetical protein HQK76_08395 [Desulfobacterales bacterium]|nr:hypothetical protein [Desulfobacterales bacterium]